MCVYMYVEHDCCEEERRTEDAELARSLLGEKDLQRTLNFMDVNDGRGGIVGARHG